MKLITRNMNGNLHDIAKDISDFQWAEYFVQAYPVNPTIAIVIFRVPLDRPEIIKELES